MFPAMEKDRKNIVLKDLVTVSILSLHMLHLDEPSEGFMGQGDLEAKVDKLIDYLSPPFVLM